LVYFEVAGETWAASPARFAALLPAARSQITASGNHARSSQRLAGAMVSIIDTRTAGISFSGNQCDLQSGGGLREVVILGAPRVSASGNVVTHVTDAISLRIVTGRSGAAAPIGNITSAGISVHPGGVPPAFVPLNLNA
jgi:hypothetical protein